MSLRHDAIHRLSALGPVQHIALEEHSPLHSGEAKQPHRITRHHYRLASALHGCSTELALLEGHYLRVYSKRARRAERKYQFDLRYVHPQPVRVKRIAWSWLGSCTALAAIGVGALSVLWDSGVQRTPALITGAAFTASAIALFAFLRRTTESLEFRSEHGMATVVKVMGGLGSTRKGQPFFVELIKSIHAAKQEGEHSKQQLLCGEMREHYRLYELGVLSKREYEQSKARILAEHSI